MEQVNRYYHIFYTGGNKEALFRDDEDHLRFVNGMQCFLGPSFYVIAYCLMQDRCHIIIKSRTIKRDHDGDCIAGPELKSLRMSFTRTTNNKYKRKGSIFAGPFKVQSITNRHFLKLLISYIHRLPVQQEITKDPISYPYSSYRDIIIERNRVVDLGQLDMIYETMDHFLEIHRWTVNNLPLEELKTEI